MESSKDYNSDEKIMMKVAVFIHELGEVDYIVSKLPTITHDEWNYNGDIINYDLRVLISHYHINKLIEKFKLDDFVNKHLKCRKVIQNNFKNWEKIIEICWILVTYPSLDYDINQLGIEAEEKILKGIEEIIDITRNIDTLNQSSINIKHIEEKFNDIISILNSYGMGKYIKENEYRYEVKVVSRIDA